MPYKIIIKPLLFFILLSACQTDDFELDMPTKSDTLKLAVYSENNIKLIEYNLPNYSQIDSIDGNTYYFNIRGNDIATGEKIIITGNVETDTSTTYIKGLLDVYVGTGKNAVEYYGGNTGYPMSVVLNTDNNEEYIKINTTGITKTIDSSETPDFERMGLELSTITIYR